MAVHDASAQMKLQPAGEQLVARSFYVKGKNFLVASSLLKKHLGDPYVVMYLRYQGIEVLFKGLLLLHDYPTYRNKNPKAIRHNLVLLTQETLQAWSLAPLTSDQQSELAELNKYYSDEQLLRYGSILDILQATPPVLSAGLEVKLEEVIRFADQHFMATGRGASNVSARAIAALLLVRGGDLLDRAAAFVLSKR